MFGVKIILKPHATCLFVEFSLSFFHAAAAAFCFQNDFSFLPFLLSMPFLFFFSLDWCDSSIYYGCAVRIIRTAAIAVKTSHSVSMRIISERLKAIKAQRWKFTFAIVYLCRWTLICVWKFIDFMRDILCWTLRTFRWMNIDFKLNWFKFMTLTVMSQNLRKLFTHTCPMGAKNHIFFLSHTFHHTLPPKKEDKFISKWNESGEAMRRKREREQLSNAWL